MLSFGHHHFRPDPPSHEFIARQHRQRAERLLTEAARAIDLAEKHDALKKTEQRLMET